MLAPAKINLDLRVLGRRPDGYHRLDSKVVFAAYGDEVALTHGSPGLSIDGPFAEQLQGQEVRGQELQGDNLVLRAANKLAECSGRTLSVGFKLTKRLPVSAGLGGGSSDAAAVLRLLARAWDLDWRSLGELALSLGADVPVCLHRTAARMTGIGECIEPFEQQMRAGLAGRPILLVNPRDPVSTERVFAVFAAMGASRPAANMSAEGLSANDLLSATLEVQPAVGDVLRALSTCKDVNGYGMSGTGPSCFALFDRAADCRTAGERIAADNPGWWVQPSCLL